MRLKHIVNRKNSIISLHAHTDSFLLEGSTRIRNAIALSALQLRTFWGYMYDNKSKLYSADYRCGIHIAILHKYSNTIGTVVFSNKSIICDNDGVE